MGLLSKIVFLQLGYIQIFGFGLLFAQTKPNQNTFLEKSVSISAQNITLDQVFDQLSKQCNCYFTYDAVLINGNKLVTFSSNHLLLKNVLDTLLQNPTFSYEVINNQVVIHPLKISAVNDSIGYSKYLFVSGTIVNNSNKEPLPFTSIAIKNNFIGGISNESGFFSLKIPISFFYDTLVFSYLGFYNLEMPIRDIPKNGLIFLSEGQISIQEIIVRSKDPRLIIRKARESINSNYRNEAYNYEAFYREAVKSDNRYSIYSEALISGYKPSLNTLIDNDKVQLQKARKFTNIKQTDTLMVKLRGGMEACFQLDIVHHLPDFLTLEGEKMYAYHLNDMVVWFDELVYAIGFKQLSHISEPMLEGQVYINTTNYAIIGAEFYFASEKLRQSDKLFVIRKSMQTRVKPMSAKYMVRYIPIKNKYYVQYVRGELQLHVRKNKQLFNRNFSTMMEMVYTGNDTLNCEKPLKRDLFQTHSIFSDSEYVYDDDFWKQQNIIQPEENILEALKKSGFQLQQQGVSKE
ncbi:MAG: carboxypeptidase-like regulatory domain-containing protein [Salinivirgaceae bacterium]